MEKVLVRDYLIEWTKKELPEIVKRELEVERTKQRIASIIGPRRSGKTYYFFQLIRENKKESLYLNFEDTRLMDLNFREIRDLIRMFIEITGKEPKRLFFDEVQNVKNWEFALRELLDARKYEIYVTGSSSKLLSKEIATSLRGRTLSYLLLSFSFREFLIAKGKKIEKLLTKDEEAKIKSLLKEYLTFGGFPEIVLGEEKERILREYVEMILFRDIIERYKIKNMTLARFLLFFILQNFSKEISINKITNFAKSRTKLSKNTIYSYVDKIQDSVAIFFLNRHSTKIYERESWPKKVYICDNGLTKVIRFSEDLGKLIENAVFLELLRIQNTKPLLEIFYWRDSGGKEVDFVLKEGAKIKNLLQVTYVSSKDEIEKREINALLKASEELKCRNMTIITWDYEDKLKFGNKLIKCIPLWKYLLQESL